MIFTFDLEKNRENLIFRDFWVCLSFFRGEKRRRDSYEGKYIPILSVVEHNDITRRPNHRLKHITSLYHIHFNIQF